MHQGGPRAYFNIQLCKARRIIADLNNINIWTCRLHSFQAEEDIATY